MVLQMALPFQHPKTGIFWLRKRVPTDLVSVVGRKEERFSLGTRDPKEAKRRHVEALAKLEKRWEQCRVASPPPPPKGFKPAVDGKLTEREAHLRAAWMFEFWLRKHQDNPSEQTFWRTDLFEKLWKNPPRMFDANGAPAMGKITGAQVRERMAAQEREAWCLREADEVLALHDLIVDEESRLKLAKAIAAAVQRASIALQQQARGEFTTSPSRGADGGEGITSNHPKHSRPVDLAGLFEEWAAERQPAAKTHYEWRRVIEELVRFLGHKDAARITPSDLIGWKARLVEDGCRPKTIRDAKLAPVRAVLQWGVNNQRLTSNAAAGVTIELKSRAGEGRRSFTDAEAELVLTAAQQQSDPVLRSIPWLCAYTGGRISEVAQLRRTDVLELDGIWCVKFDPAAGPLKNRGSERLVPIHSALLEAGFLGFVDGIAEGPLFQGYRSTSSESAAEMARNYWVAGSGA